MPRCNHTFSISGDSPDDERWLDRQARAAQDARRFGRKATPVPVAERFKRERPADFRVGVRALGSRA